MSSFSLDSKQQSISKKIFNADSFSIFTSIGLHLLILGVLLPSLWQFSSDSKPTEQQRTVGVIDLSPIEQSRLPNLSPTPEVPSVPSVPNIPSLDSSAIPDLSSLNPVNPPLSSIPSLPSLPSLPPLPPIGSGSYSPPSVNVYAPPVPSIRIPRNQQNFPPAPPYLPAPPNNPNLEVAKPRAITRPQFDPFRDTLDLENLRRAPINASQEEQFRNQQQREVSPAPETANELQNPAISTLPNQTAILAERQRRLLNDVLEGSASVQKDPNNTTDEEARKNYVNWLNRVKEAQPEAAYVTGTYPKAACSTQIEGTSVYGVSVNPQGIIAGTPYLLKSAGYPLLNQKAFQTVRGINFQNTSGQVKSYRVSVNYKYDPSVCPAYTQPLDPNPPVETRVNPPQTPVLDPQKTPVTPQPRNQTPSPATSPQTPANRNPENVRVAPPITPKPENNIPQTPVNPPEENLINTPSGNPKPENIVPQTPINPPDQKTEQPVIPQVTPSLNPQPSVEEPPANQKPDIQPPSPPTSKKPEPPLAESIKP